MITGKQWREMPTEEILNSLEIGIRVLRDLPRGSVKVNIDYLASLIEDLANIIRLVC